MNFLNRLAGMAVVTVSALSLTGPALAADYNWTFQTSETAGEPGFVNKQKWAEEVGKLSGGRIEIEILPIGSVVPHTDTLDAVGAGILQGHLTDPSYFSGKDPAFAMMGNLVGAWSDPFELLGFMESGGGNELYAELVEPYGVQFIGAAATEPEAFVSRVPIRTVEDLKGVKMRPSNATQAQVFKRAGAVTVFSPFDADTDYFPKDRAFMLNFRVENLAAACADLTAAGIETGDVVTMDGVGHFARIHDPEGNPIELWEPASPSS